MSNPVGFTTGVPETVLPIASEAARGRLEGARSQPLERRRDALADVVRSWPAWSEAWAELADFARDDVEAYAYYRVGYHRGLDALRAAGWRGSGYVRWTHVPNRGFLRCVEGLRATAAAIGEVAEEERCTIFLRQLDPTWPPADLGAASSAP